MAATLQIQINNASLGVKFNYFVITSVSHSLGCLQPNHPGLLCFKKNPLKTNIELKRKRKLDKQSPTDTVYKATYSKKKIRILSNISIQV